MEKLLNKLKDEKLELSMNINKSIARMSWYLVELSIILWDIKAEEEKTSIQYDIRFENDKKTALDNGKNATQAINDAKVNNSTLLEEKWSLKSKRVKLELVYQSYQNFVNSVKSDRNYIRQDETNIKESLNN